jgi:hypothetical protein
LLNYVRYAFTGEEQSSGRPTASRSSGKLEHNLWSLVPLLFLFSRQEGKFSKSWERKFESGQSW